MNFPLAVADIHEIAPPVDYSLVPPWVIWSAVVLGLLAIGALAWWIRKLTRRAPRVLSPRERALEKLRQISAEMEMLTPYRFSIAVSDILRTYVTEQYNLPVTRQTSVEFLSLLAQRSPFSADETSLLEDFLGRCDLIKFARYDATPHDSQLLLEEATQFVKGAKLEPA
jgi:hypothetical protein